MREQAGKRKKPSKMSVVLSLVAVVVVLLCTAMVVQGRQVIHSEMERYLGELSGQTTHKINQTVAYMQEIIQRVGSNVVLLDEQEDEALVENYLNNMSASSYFQWVSHVNEDNLLQMETGELVDVSGLEVVEHAWHGAAGVSRDQVTIFNGKPGILYAAPMIKDGRIDSVVLGFVPEEQLMSLIDADSFNGISFTYVINGDGDYILHTNNSGAVLNRENFFQDMEELVHTKERDALDVMKRNMTNGERGNLYFQVNGKEDRFMYYMPLGVEDWYVISVIPPQAYAEEIVKYSIFALCISMGIIAIFFLLLIFIFRSTDKQKKEMETIAYVDPVTYGYTALRFEKELKEKMLEQLPVSFVSLDIRRFKLINDSFSSVEGDRVLRHTYRMILENLRPGEFVARIDGDSFNIVMNSTSQVEITARLNKITEEVNSFNKEIDGLYYLPIDCGVYLISDRTEDIYMIRDRANTARKNNKDIGDRSICSCIFYSDMERLQMLKEKEMENSMERALENREFVTYLQPKIGLRDNRIISAEALVRWDSPEKGMIFPDEFIPFFEKNGFITKVDLYVFEDVCKLIRKWMDHGIEPLPISVNLSRSHLRRPGFLKNYKEVQERYGIPPQLLEIELTETVVFENLEFLKQVIDDIHQMGFQCSMDDFGSGYSSLNVLKEVPVDILKLDRAFFTRENDKRGNVVVESVIELAKKLHMVTVAEGVETIPQVEFLKHADCDMVQGYVFSRPVSVEQFEELAGMK